MQLKEDPELLQDNTLSSEVFKRDTPLYENNLVFIIIYKFIFDFIMKCISIIFPKEYINKSFRYQI